MGTNPRQPAQILAAFFRYGYSPAGAGIFPRKRHFHPDGGYYGLIIAGLLWFILSLSSYFAGNSILLSISGAREISHDVHPRLFNTVEEMKIAANLPALPKIYIIDDPAMNAFATGRNPQTSAVAVTAGLLNELDRDQLQGVVAHEMSHILNRDILFMTFAGVMLGSIVIISEVFLRGMWYSGGASSRRYRSSGGKGNQIQALMMVIALVLAILAPIMARLLYFAISRKREYLADASAVRLTRYPEGLASALQKIASCDKKLARPNKAMAPLFIDDPLRERDYIVKPVSPKKRFSNPFATHPPIQDRIAVLRKIAGGVSYLEYQKAFGAGLMPPSALADSTVIPLRKPSEKAAEEKSPRAKQRDLGDLMRAVNQFAFLLCPCGLKLKIPPDFKKSQVKCPKCGRIHQTPIAEIAAVTAAATAGMDLAKGKSGKQTEPETPKPVEPRVYHRRAKNLGWESFYCSCGKLLQLSPQFEGDSITCKKCGGKTMVK